MSPRKSDATRRRLLDAATADFAAHGIAGARVDRIAAAAGVNKAQLYAYFGDKLGLFGAVFRLHADAVVDSVPFTADDLPGYAVRLYDAAVARPELVRLATWAKLEGVATDNLATESSAGAAKLRAIAEAQRAGQVDASIEPRDVLALLIAMALAWSPSGLAAATTPGDAATDHDRRKRALSTAVSGAFRAGAGNPPQG
ncbi:TetR/AcrR family transcriptional regulator [Streptomyces hygroscopicus]|uniref:TetR/AcrR family transcriptional regulator n=1 Tax=Streptomyces hygroscopicus TaxID=1912 RepID=UPI000767B0F3|nr:TetR/AcrR family transcriptional regulator [Streptomyces hygroscopicus]